MLNSHLRLGRLEYLKSTEKIHTHVTAYVSHYIGEKEQAHLVSIFGRDADVGAMMAAVLESHTFQLFPPHGPGQTIRLGEHASCYKGALTVPGEKRPLRHLLAVSSVLRGNGSLGRTILPNYQEWTQELAWATLASLQGIPADPRWGKYMFAQLKKEGKIIELDGIGCRPVAVLSTRAELLQSLGHGCATGALPFPGKNGPVIWPTFSFSEMLTAA